MRGMNNAIIAITSGVIIADKIKKNITANRHFFIQKSAFMIPRKLSKITNKGNRNISPIPIIRPETYWINLSIEKNGTTPMLVAKG